MKKTLLFLTTIIVFAACQSPKSPVEDKADDIEIKDENWSANSTIYEANIRQMTEEGTFKAFQDQHLDRLADMGIEILWLMPIYPIGEKNRKGTLGSYYAVQDYQAVNPEHGTMDEFKTLVDAAHEKGMKVILDWVANHTAWDNVWLANHPEWFTTDSAGNFVPPVADWSDVMDLNYDNMKMREAMIQSMEFWIREADVDGFRCDVAEMVPLDFWIETRKRLDAVKPIFFLAEGEPVELHQAFDMTYSWSFHHLMNEVSRGEKGASDIASYYAGQDTLYQPSDYRMQFITNHDENSWNGTAIERMGDNRKAFAILSFTIPGMSLIYSGQEADMTKRLEFFEKDPIDWKDYSLGGFYKKLVSLKANQPVLANGVAGGELEFYKTGNESVLAFSRTNENEQVLVVLNFGGKEVNFSIEDESFNGSYKSCFGTELMEIETILEQTIPANGYLVLSR